MWWGSYGLGRGLLWTGSLTSSCAVHLWQFPALKPPPSPPAAPPQPPALEPPPSRPAAPVAPPQPPALKPPPSTPAAPPQPPPLEPPPSRPAAPPQPRALEPPPFPAVAPPQPQPPSLAEGGLVGASSAAGSSCSTSANYIIGTIEGLMTGISLLIHYIT